MLANAPLLVILLPECWLYGGAISARTTVALVVGFVGWMLVPVVGVGLVAVALEERLNGWTAVGLIGVLGSRRGVLGPRSHWA